MEKAQAEDYLSSLLNKTLRITTTDTRMFLGMFKCTDSDRNIILSQTFEYRLPPPPKPIPSFLSISKPSTTIEPQSIVLDLTSRYLGLVVVPGEFITKIEVEEFVSQLRGKERENARLALQDQGLGHGQGLSGNGVPMGVI